MESYPSWPSVSGFRPAWCFEVRPCCSRHPWLFPFSWLNCIPRQASGLWIVPKSSGEPCRVSFLSVAGRKAPFRSPVVNRVSSGCHKAVFRLRVGVQGAGCPSCRTRYSMPLPAIAVSTLRINLVSGGRIPVRAAASLSDSVPGWLAQGSGHLSAGSGLGDCVSPGEGVGPVASWAVLSQPGQQVPPRQKSSLVTGTVLPRVCEAVLFLSLVTYAVGGPGRGIYLVCCAVLQGLTAGPGARTAISSGAPLVARSSRPPLFRTRPGAWRHSSLVSRALSVIGLNHLAELSPSDSDRLLFCGSSLFHGFSFLFYTMEYNGY